MTTQPLGRPGMPPTHALRLAVVVVVLGIVTLLAASVDPWMLVLVAGLGLAAYAVYDGSGEGWLAAG